MNITNNKTVNMKNEQMRQRLWSDCVTRCMGDMTNMRSGNISRYNEAVIIADKALEDFDKRFNSGDKNGA